MNDNYNYCHVVGKTDVGRKRAANEDNMYNTITQNGLVSVVCDGMGGHVGGATASKIAVSTIIENLNNVYYDDPRIAIGESIDKANRAIIQKTIEQPELAGVLLLVRSGKVYIGHVGDSRIYLVRSKRIVQLTKDHSYVQMLVDCGEITKEQAEHHPRKNEITNALGIPNMSPATVADDAIIPEAGDCFVLCSDGLSGMISDDTICKIISRQSEMNAQERVDRLVALANENGGVDNITIQLVEFPVSPIVITDKKNFPTWTKITSIVSILIVLGIGSYFFMKEKPTSPDDNKPQEETENVIKCDTTDYYCPEKIVFKKRATIVELEFGESSLILKRDGKQIYKFDSAFDQHSLNVSTPNVDVQYNNSLLSFTDKNPGDIVEFYITQSSDKTKTYKCIFDISTTEGLTIPANVLNQNKNKKDESKGTEVKKEEAIKVDTVYVQFDYDKLEKGARLLLNYSATPTLIFNSKEVRKEEKIAKPKLERVLEGLVYDDLYWIKKPNNSQLLFEFKGESSDKQHTIVIPCAVKGSKDQVLISVKISPRKDKENGNVTPIEEKKKDNNIELQSA